MISYLASSSWPLSNYRKFLYGLRAYGRGNWKSISKDFVPNKTPIQISSHAQKYFKRLESPNKKQRYSINDVGLYDAEAWAHNNASSWEGLTFSGGSHNPKQYSSGSQPATMTQVTSPVLQSVGQGSSSQTTTLVSGLQQQVGTSSSSMDPMMDGPVSHMSWTSDPFGDFLGNPWMMNMHMN